MFSDMLLLIQSTLGNRIASGLHHCTTDKDFVSRSKYNLVNRYERQESISSKEKTFSNQKNCLRILLFHPKIFLKLHPVSEVCSCGNGHFSGWVLDWGGWVVPRAGEIEKEQRDPSGAGSSYKSLTQTGHHK